MTTELPITSVPLSAAEQVSARIADLQVALQTQSPAYESMLHTIHVALHRDEEIVNLLKPEEIGTICMALSKKKNVIIAAIETKSKKSTTSSGKKLKDVTLADL